MEIIGLLLAPIAFGGYIWLLVRAFKTSLSWGFWLLLGSLIIYIATALVVDTSSIMGIIVASALSLGPSIHFASKHWETAQKPFLTYLISSVLFLVFSASIIANLGSPTLEKLIAQTQKGEISKEEAAQQLRRLVQSDEDSSALSEQEKLSMRTAKNIITQVEKNLEEDPDYYKRETDLDYQRDLANIEAQRKREASRKKLESRLSQRQALENKPQEKKPVVFPVIKKNEVKKYIGSKLIVETITGVKHTAFLKDFNEESYRIILEKERTTGVLKLKIHMSDIKSIHLIVDE